MKKNETLIIGSSWKSDIKILKEGILKNDKLKFIIAPHNVNKDEIIFIENSFPNNTIKYSDLDLNKYYDKNILIIDNIGMLSSIYRYGNIAYIGGGFEGTLHNSLEAAIWDLPILYGKHKNNKKFYEIIFPICDMIEEHNFNNDYPWQLSDSWGYKHSIGDHTKFHTHSLSIVSGAIMLNQHPQSLYFPEIKEKLECKPGNFVLFSSFLKHGNKRNESYKPRYGLSFNFNYKERKI